MRILGLTRLLFAILITICSATSLTNEEIAKILVDTSRGETLAGLDEFEHNPQYGDIRDKLRTLDLNLDADEGALYPNDEPEVLADGGVSKRPFCNGFTGCGRIHGKRTSSSSLLEKLQISNSDARPIAPTAAKRPFCNGFFGCGNPGKRLVFRNFVNPRVYGVQRSPQRKRFFCNPGAFGCANRVRRSPLKSVLTPADRDLLS